MSTSDKITSAFPMPHFTDQNAHTHWGFHGMALRDYFAAAALQGLLADTNYREPAEVAAKTAYEAADAMMEERAK